MPAEVESLMYARAVPWHGFGTKVDGLQTAADAIVSAGLAWPVEQKPLFVRDVTNPKGTIKKVDGKVANIRMSDGKVLGLVSPSYKVVQNVDAFAMADAIVESGEAKYETAGSLRGGKVVFLSMEIPKHVKVPGDDGEHRPYLLVTNGHDGTMALRAMVTLIRVVCMNTLTAALGSHSAEIRLRHTSGVTERVEEAQRTLGLTYAYLDEFEQTAARMLLTKLGDKDVLRAITTLFPIKDVNPAKLSAAELTRVLANEKNLTSQAAKVLRLYQTSDNIANVRGTGWGLYNAVAEGLDYATGYRSREDSAEGNRATAILLGGAAAKTKQKAADLILKYASN